MRNKLIFLFMIVVLLLSACAAPATPDVVEPPAEAPAAEEPAAEEPAEATPTTKAIEAVEATPTLMPTVETAKYKEAPMLAEKVLAGDLPPVDERLPLQPLVTDVVDEIGQYGGTFHTFNWWPGAGHAMLFIYDPPIRYKPDLTGYEAGLIEAYSWSDDGKTFTMNLRAGLKWSDGEPYTSEDWRFWWEDMAVDEEYKVSSVPGWLRNSDGAPITMEFPDDYTVVWKADKPLWTAPYQMASFWDFANNIMKPAHYLKQFHPKYSEGKTYEDLEKADPWGGWSSIPGYPCLMAWCPEKVSDDQSRITLARNPYYWRIDAEGNQLPYIDYFEVEVVGDEQTRILNTMKGKYDMVIRGAGGPNETPLYQENQEKGDYRLLDGFMNGAGMWPCYGVNQDYVEGGKNYAADTPEVAQEVRGILRDKRFRQALSIGFDRVRLIDVVWGGIGETSNSILAEQSLHFASPEGQAVYQEAKNAWTQFDADAANALLDEIGMLDKDGDGWRDLPSGKPFTIAIDLNDWGGVLKVQTDAAAEMKVEWEKNLKLKVEIFNMQGMPEGGTRVKTGQYMLKAYATAEFDMNIYPYMMFPISNDFMWPAEGMFYATGGAEGLKPEPGTPAEKLQAIWEAYQNEPDLAKRDELVWEAVRITSIDEGPFCIGIAGDQPMPVIAKNNLKNVSNWGITGSWSQSVPGSQNPSQWYFKQ